MELTGKVFKKLEAIRGTSARGEWIKQEFVITVQDGQYEKQVNFSVWDQDGVNNLARFKEGEEIKVAFNLSSREYNGRWFLEARAWRIEATQDRTQTRRPAAAPAPAPSTAAAPQYNFEDDPF